ncbi:MAG TPA: dipeptidase [bacterium]|nr:dipeptidase [bacterium]
MKLSDQALALHRSSLVIDLHADTTIPMKWMGYRIEKKHEPGLPGRLGFFHCDIPRWKEGGYGGQFIGLGTFPYPESGSARSCLRQAEMILKACARNPGDLEFVTTAAGITEARARGRIAVLLGVEGGHNLENDPANVKRFYGAGVRYLGLAHFTRNRLCAPSGGIGADANAPLTALGREVIGEMNRLGMMVDLAHVGRRAFLEAARLSERPVLVSHTGISAARPHWRNLDDEQIRAVADKDGVIGIIFAWRYICNNGRGDLRSLLPHFEHVRSLVGSRHLALGSDFDGAVVPVRGLEDASHLPAITQMLLEAAWREDEIRGVLGENALRVLAANE